MNLMIYNNVSKLSQNINTIPLTSILTSDLVYRELTCRHALATAVSESIQERSGIRNPNGIENLKSVTEKKRKI